MRVISLNAENFKILKAVEINPDAHMVTIGGRNGAGKSSVLDALWVALAGKAKAPSKPIRAGEEQCKIVVELGDGDFVEYRITRTFNAKEGEKFTDTVKVESGDGKQRYNSPQRMLDDLLGAIGFDPLEFVQKKTEDQAAMLLELVPLSIDLEALAREDSADYQNRTLINRDAASLKSRLDVIVVPDDLPPEKPDREALVAQLGNAADHNTGIERERMIREQRQDTINQRGQDTIDLLARIDSMRREIVAAEAEATMLAKGTKERQSEFDALPPLPEPIDTEVVRQRIIAAETVLAGFAARDSKALLAADHAAKAAESEALTNAMAAREKRRRDALTKAKMPIAGLGFAINERGKPVVMFNGQPFDQASSAEQIRASTAIAMAANPELRVLRIKDGSLLDDESLAAISEMAEAEDFQLWLEKVGTGGVGIIIENGSIKGAETAENPASDDKLKTKPKPKAGKPDGTLL